VAIGCHALDDRHEVEHFADTVCSQEPRDQDSSVGEVQLPAHVVVPVGPDVEVPAAVVVEQGSEDARGVETRAAKPIDSSVGTYEGCRLQVADETVLTDVGVAIHRNVLSSLSSFWFPPFCITLVEHTPQRGDLHPRR
jgi:hypothetical protein